MIRYYRVDLGSAPSGQQARIDQMLAAVPEGTGRTLPHQVLNWRRSLDQRYILADADVTDAEHARLMNASYVTHLGTVEDARSYLDANIALWETPKA